MHQTIQLAILGVAAGCLYALMAAGLVLTYRSSKVLNFAHGGIATFGTFAFLHAVNEWAWPTWAGVLFGIAVSMAIGMTFQALVLRPLRHAPPLARVVSTLGLLVALTASIIPVFDVERPRAVRFFGSGLVSLPFGNPRFTIPVDRVVVCCITAAILGGLYVVYRSTRFGRATRAAADNELATALLGLSPQRVELTNWALGSGLAAVAGMLLASISQPDPHSFTLVMITALAAALVAGFRSFSVMLVAGMFLGVVQSVLLRYGTNLESWTGLAGWGQALPFIAIITAVVWKGTTVAGKGAFDERSLPKAPVSRHPVRWGAVCAGCGTLWIMFAPQGALNPITVSLIGVVLALSVVVVTGFAGQISLVQMGLAGVGAWITARFAEDIGLPFPLPILAGALIAIPVGVIVGLPALRVRGQQLAIVTLGAAMVLDVMFFNDRELSGADAGLPVPKASLFGLDIDGAGQRRRYAVVCLVITVLVCLGIHALRRSKLGAEMLACRSNERGAAAVGLSVPRTKLAAFAIGACVAAVAGGMQAYRGPNIGWALFTFTASIFLVSIVYIGGISSIGGAIVAGVATKAGVLSYYLHFEGSAARVYEVIGGIAVMAVVVLQPEGASSGPRHGAHLLRHRLHAHRGTASTAAVASTSEPPREDAGARAGALADLAEVPRR
jgi:branched-subunit amino acid ABC-type transport system permease component